MITLTVYRKDHRRQPVRFGYTPFCRDHQADIPKNWCYLCGSEIFDEKQDLCIRCRGTKGENRR